MNRATNVPSCLHSLPLHGVMKNITRTSLSAHLICSHNSKPLHLLHKNFSPRFRFTNKSCLTGTESHRIANVIRRKNGHVVYLPCLYNISTVQNLYRRDFHRRETQRNAFVFKQFNTVRLFSNSLKESSLKQNYIRIVPRMFS